MDIDTTEHARHDEAGGAEPPSRSLLRRVGPPAAVALLVLLALAVAAAFGLRATRPGVLPGVEVEGVPVGGLDQDALRVVVASMAAERSDAPVTVVPATDATPGEGPGGLTTAAAELGYRLDVDDTVDAAWSRGRQGNVLAAAADHVRAFWDSTGVAADEQVDDVRLRQWVQQAAEDLRRPPVEGTVEFDGATVERVDPVPGAQMLTAPLVEDVRAAVLRPGPDTVEAPTEPIPPATTAEDVDELAAAARRAVSAPVTLRRSGSRVRLSPRQIAGLLEVTRSDGAAGARLALDIPPRRLTGLLGPGTIANLESEPVSAGFEVSGESVSVVPASAGFRFDAQRAADQLLQVLTGDADRNVRVEGEVLEPERTTEEARELGITEQVSSFTTEHACCQNRVTNIHRIADIVDGVVVAPGETFSLNGYVGERTIEKGFVADGAISAGEFVEQVGGGVSQFATTMFNAAFFGGYDIPDYKAHSQYISRYPAGREATLNYPNVDLKITNNSPYGILVKTSYSGTSITVTFYGTEWVDVKSISGPRTNYRGPETIYRENNDLPPGETRVVQEGAGQGFDITVTRVKRFPDGRVERDEFFTRYVARPEIIERNT